MRKSPIPNTPGDLFKDRSYFSSGNQLSLEACSRKFPGIKGINPFLPRKKPFAQLLLGCHLTARIEQPYLIGAKRSNLRVNANRGRIDEHHLDGKSCPLTTCEVVQLQSHSQDL